MPADGMPSPRTETSARPSRKAALEKIAGCHAYPKDHHIGQDVAQTIRLKPMAPMSEMGTFGRWGLVTEMSALPSEAGIVR